MHRVGTESYWNLLALDEQALEQTDLVAANLTVAREIPALAGLDISRYVEIVDGWTDVFRAKLPSFERRFAASPQKWKNDIRFFRIGMLAAFLGMELGLQYIEEHKHATAVYYTDPSDLFVNGLIDKRVGTCGNMSTLHVAMCRKLGWPVSLAVVKTHLLSRFDDGQMIHNIEATQVEGGSFCSEDDSFYVNKYKLPRRAIDCGSDLRKLSMREMIGVFFALAGRHFMDTRRVEMADRVFSMSRALFPRYRQGYIGAMVPMLNRGEELFHSGELGHPNLLLEDLGAAFAKHGVPREQKVRVMSNVEFIPVSDEPASNLPPSFSTRQIAQDKTI